MNLVESREPINGGLENWLIAVDSRALALESCGCGEPIICHAVMLNGQVLESTFVHPPEAANCRMAFASDNYRPLPYDEYAKIVGIEVD